MAWRAKISKYKNTTPKIPKKEEWITGISAGRLLHSQGNHIKASNLHIAFNVDSSGGGSICIVPLNFSGRVDSIKCNLHAHGGYVTDFDFSPFDDGLLATGSKDCTVKLWSIPDEGLVDEELKPTHSFHVHGNKVENVLWNPCAENVLSVTSCDSIQLFDTNLGVMKHELACGDDQIQAISWKGDGTIFGTTNRDQFLRIHDPRCSVVIMETVCSETNKDSRLAWAGTKDYVITTGYNTARHREVKIFDTRNFTTSVGSVTVDTYTGLMMPLFDADTDMLFLPGIGDSSLKFFEVTESSPYLSLAASDLVEQTKGAALIPKLSVDVMKGEVNRVLLLTKQAIVPVPYIVPRKSYTDFHGELFPETCSHIPALNAAEWFAGSNGMMSKINLDPAERPLMNYHRKVGCSHFPRTRAEPKVQIPDAGLQTIPTHVGQSHQSSAAIDPSASGDASDQRHSALISTSHPSSLPAPSSQPAVYQPKAQATPSYERQDPPAHAAVNVMMTTDRKPEKVFSLKQKPKLSKYKNTTPKVPKKEEWITGISAGRLLHSQGNHIKASNLHIAFNVDSSGGGGIIGILPFNYKGRAEYNHLHYHVHSDYVTDLDFSLFDDGVLATGSKDCTVKIWSIPDEGPSTSELTESHSFSASGKRVENVLWHPCAENVLSATASNLVMLFDVASGAHKCSLISGEDQLYGISWKADGTMFATSNKDRHLRIHDPRSPSLFQETMSQATNKDSRVVWLGNRDQILTTGYDTMRQRIVKVYDSRYLTDSVGSMMVDASTSLMMPLYDADTDILILPGIGDSSVRFLELSEHDPFIALGANDTVEQTKGAALIPKLSVDVMKGEVNRVLLLTKQAIVPVPYIVPRKNYTDYHGELFPDTSSCVPALTSEEWFAGSNSMVSTVTLDPAFRPDINYHRRAGEGGGHFPRTHAVQPPVIMKPTAPAVTRPESNGNPTPSLQLRETSNRATDQRSFSTEPSIIKDTTDSSALPGFRTSVIEPNVASDVAAKSKVVPLSDKLDFRETTESKPVEKVISFKREKPKLSKYKNTTPKVPRKEEWITGISAGRVLHSQGNHIKASNLHMAFNVDSSGGGGFLGILPLNYKGRAEYSDIHHHMHSDYVQDFDFSPFDDGMLATGSKDCTVKLWSIPDEGPTESSLEASHCFPVHGKKVENVVWHPCAENVLSVTSSNIVTLFDAVSGAQRCSLLSGEDQLQSISWKADGTIFATTNRDKNLRIHDPRSPSHFQETFSHEANKDTRAVWVGNRDHILTTGYNAGRQRILKIFDSRYFTSSLASMFVDSSTSLMMPLYDADTDILILPGIGDSSIRFLELAESDPYILLGANDMIEQTKGAALIPKLSVDVMKGEVNRVLLLTKQAIVPVPYIVPRKNYIDYHGELFPDTFSCVPALNSEEWFAGSNSMMKKISLDPEKRPPMNFHRGTSNISLYTSTSISGQQNEQKDFDASETKVDAYEKVSVHSRISRMEESSVSREEAGLVRAAVPDLRADQSHGQHAEQTTDHPHSLSAATYSQQEQPAIGSRKSTSFSHSKFRHLKGTPLSRNLQVENIRNLNSSLPGESDLFHANADRCAIPLSGPGGIVAVIESSFAGRLPSADLPVLHNGSLITDFAWDPFDNTRLAVSCDDGRIKIWNIPQEGLTEVLTEPSSILIGHKEKVYFVKFHPLAKDVIASASFDMMVKVWDMTTEQAIITLQGHTDTIFCFAWSPDGKQCATVCKDGLIRIFNPRRSNRPIKEGPGPEGQRGARISWVCGGTYLLVSGFDRESTRTISLFDPVDLSKSIVSTKLESSPSILIPFYDEDTSTLFLTGRGDSSLYAFEISEEFPHFYELSTVHCNGPHKAFSFLPKKCVNVRDVEFAKAACLTATTIEHFSFTVPRVKVEYFQDDIFPDTKVTWEPSLFSHEWFYGVDRESRKISLKPSNMLLVSSVAIDSTPKVRKYESYNPDTYKTDEQKKDELVDAVMSKLSIQDEPLPQDLTEGVDDDEWDD